MGEDQASSEVRIPRRAVMYRKLLGLVLISMGAGSLVIADVWKAEELGGGYSAPAIAAGRIFGLSFRGQDEVVWALDEKIGKELWKTRIAEAKEARMKQGREGSRGTPNVDGDVLYALGQNGDLVCLETATSNEHWHKNLVSDLGGAVPTWGYAESPLIDGAKVIVTPGGSD